MIEMAKLDDFWKKQYGGKLGKNNQSCSFLALPKFKNLEKCFETLFDDPTFD